MRSMQLFMGAWLAGSLWNTEGVTVPLGSLALPGKARRRQRRRKV